VTFLEIHIKKDFFFLANIICTSDWKGLEVSKSGNLSSNISQEDNKYNSNIFPKYSKAIKIS